MKKILLLLTGIALIQLVSAQSFPAELDSSIARKNKIKSVTVCNKREKTEKERKNPEQKILFNRSGSIVSDEKGTGHKTLYFYDDKNRLIRTEFYNPGGIQKGYSLHKYEKNRREHSYYEDSVLVSEDIYLYSHTGKLVSLTHKSKGKFYSESAYVYNENDSLLYYIYKTGSNKSVQDRNGNVIEIISYQWGDTLHNKVRAVKKYSYDSKGNRVLQTDSSSTGIRTIRFIYDADNKLIKTIDGTGRILFDASVKITEDPYSIKGTDPVDELVFIDPYKYPETEKEREKKYNSRKLLISKLLFIDENGMKTYETYQYEYFSE